MKPHRDLGWLLALALAVGCQTPITLSDTDGTTSTAAEGTTTQTPPAPSTSTTSIDPSTSTTLDAPLDGTSTGEVPIPETCDPFEQDCPPGYKCSFFSDSEFESYTGTRCVQVVDDPHGAAEPCTVTSWPTDGNDDCDATSFCFQVDPATLQGVCTTICTGSYEDPQCPEPCQICYFGGTGVPLPCRDACDPLANDCPPGRACYPFEWVFLCAPAQDSLGIGEPCDLVDVCGSGSACVSAGWLPGCDGSAGCCTPYCNPAAAFDPCPKILPGTTCTPWTRHWDLVPLEGCDHPPPGACLLP